MSTAQTEPPRDNVITKDARFAHLERGNGRVVLYGLQSRARTTS